MGFVGFVEAVEAGLWDYKDVDAGFWVDVVEGEGVFVFVDLSAGDVAGDDAAEDAVGIGHFLEGPLQDFRVRWILIEGVAIRRACQFPHVKEDVDWDKVVLR